jgi:CubicO group peptidase (beta-lactamase class C family)
MISRNAFAAALAVVCAPAYAVEPDFATKAEAIVEAAYPATGPGGAAIVTEGGKVVYVGASGMADIAKGEPLTPDTVFRLGSITKQFAAAVVLQLVAEGKLSLDDPLTKFVPGYPEPGGHATVRQLLNHTSGIQSYTGIPGWMASDKVHTPHTTAEMIAEFRDQPAEFAPGEKWNYNNSGYVLVGAVIEAVTGKPWYEAVAERITGPLGLTTIRYGGEEASIPAFATGYTAAADGKFEPAGAIDMSVPHAAGALIGTVGDLAKWSDALHHGKVVPAPLYARMIAPTPLPQGKSQPYGFGLAQDTLRGMPAITHSGGIFGFGTNAIYIPERDLFVAVFTNSDGGIQPAGMPMLRLAAEAIGKPFPTFTAIEPDLAALEPALGIYAIDGSKDTRLLFVRDGKLYTLRSGASDSPVFAAGGNRFFYGPDSLNWFELKREDGATWAMLMHQNGEEQAGRALRTGPVPEVVTVDVPRDILASYAGQYTSPIAPIAVALRDDGVLTLAFGPQQPVALQAISETEFAAIGVDARIEFTRNGDKVSGLILRQGGRELTATRDPG